ncbi:hypothetical protein FRX31_008923 [Thalictrum thalictroides]|uniref:Uncharacterized protein n=1 Tax=Thalictrum thalictroides TaxID=46969 RepID=A0A7J6WYD8_THATH|nr:hypothetical protein FRX31_008923 [Thalictrum thalictroides]
MGGIGNNIGAWLSWVSPVGDKELVGTYVFLLCATNNDYPSSALQRPTKVRKCLILVVAMDMDDGNGKNVLSLPRWEWNGWYRKIGVGCSNR